MKYPLQDGKIEVIQGGWTDFHKILYKESEAKEG